LHDQFIKPKANIGLNMFQFLTLDTKLKFVLIPNFDTFWFLNLKN